MKYRCPKCNDEIAISPSSYRTVAADAEVGLYEASCPACGYTWNPSQEEQIIIAAEIRRLLAINF
jgi:hypothetical protein